MFLDTLLGSIMRKDPNATVTWKDFVQVIKDYQANMIRVGTPAPVELSDREKLLIQRMCEGKDTAEIASELCIATRTCETLRISIKKKTGAKNIAQIVMYAVKAGIVIVD